MDRKLVPMLHKGEGEAVEIASGSETVTVTPLLPTDNAMITECLTKRMRTFSYLHSDVNCIETLKCDLTCWGKRPRSILRHNSRRCPAGMRKTSDIYLEQFPGRESNSVYPTFEAPLLRRLCKRVGPVTHYSTASALLLITTHDIWQIVADMAFGNECPSKHRQVTFFPCPKRLDSSST
jgi:hypothetical protein